MLKNVNYNLMEEIVELSQSLHRYDKYIDDARADTAGCSECMEIWTRMKVRHEEDVSALLEQLHHHVENGVLDFGLAESVPMRR
jgi:hypothetical protein